ncbi:hypothetical protein PINS_up018463, partial [Pythium insidiosum]
IVLMHMRGTPQTMTTLKTYDDVVQDVAAYLQTRVEAAKRAASTHGTSSWIPASASPRAASSTSRCCAACASSSRPATDSPCSSAPLVKGSSARSAAVPSKGRAWGTAATCCAAIAGGADVLRVHDVPAMVDVAKMADAIWRAPSP